LRDPFTDIGRTIPQFSSVGLAESKELHGVSIYKKNVFEINSKAARFLIQYTPKNVDIFRCNLAAYKQHHEVLGGNEPVYSAGHVSAIHPPMETICSFVLLVVSSVAATAARELRGTTSATIKLMKIKKDIEDGDFASP